MKLPQVVSRAEWHVARENLLVKEKEALGRETRWPQSGGGSRWSTSIRTTYFDGRQGKPRLLDLFGGRRQLIVYHSAARRIRGRRPLDREGGLQSGAAREGEHTQPKARSQ